MDPRIVRGVIVVFGLALSFYAGVPVDLDAALRDIGIALTAWQALRPFGTNGNRL